MQARYILILLLMPLMAAAVSVWKIIPGESKLMFTATQNSAPVTGVFKHFDGEINFDLNNLPASHVKIVINTASISSSYLEIADTLKGKDWFDAAQYPTAEFVSSQFVKKDDHAYEVKGNLTIRDKTLPITMQFTVLKNSPNLGEIKGCTTISRTAFGVGQGEWADTNTIKDDVKIDFILTAKK